MDNSLQVLSQVQLDDRHTLPMYGTVEEPLFRASDVAGLIEHSDVSMMLQSIDDEEKLRQAMFVSGQNRQVWFLTEDGFYEVLFQSRKPYAKAFKKCVKMWLKEMRKGNITVEYKPQSTHSASPAKHVASAKVVRAHYAAIEAKKSLLNLSQAAVASMINKTDAFLGIGGQLIDYVPSNGILLPLTELLKKHNVGMSAIAANKKLAEAGILEQHERKTHKGIKHFWALTTKGLAYGQNEVNPQNPKETQPMYFENQFTNLLQSI